MQHDCSIHLYSMYHVYAQAAFLCGLQEVVPPQVLPAGTLSPLLAPVHYRGRWASRGYSCCAASVSEPELQVLISGGREGFELARRPEARMLASCVALL